MDFNEFVIDILLSFAPSAAAGGHRDRVMVPRGSTSVRQSVFFNVGHGRSLLKIRARRRQGISFRLGCRMFDHAPSHR